MSYISVDIESDGPIIGKNSMICFGAIVVEPSLSKTFYGQVKPISNYYTPSVIEISGFTREQHMEFDDPQPVMNEFLEWIKENSKGKPVLVSDNNGYDAGWINWYFYTFIGYNPFGWSSRRIGDMFSGFYNNPFYRWKKHRITKHTHHPVDDAKGNAEALLYLQSQGFKIDLR